jgi:hypothetical protein
MAIGETVDISTRKLQSAINKVAIWTRKWRIKLNESKSLQIDFANNKIKQQPIFINGTKVPYANTAKYLGMTLDGKLRWREQILSCQSTINSLYTSKLYVQFGVMLSSSGATLVILIFKWFNATKTKYWSVLLTHHGTLKWWPSLWSRGRDGYRYHR